MRGIRQVALVVASAALASVAQAQVIIAPVSASSSLGSFDGTYTEVNTLNQSGLSASYISGVTDFLTFVTTTHTVAGANSFNAWFSPNGPTTGNFDFYLGGVQTISAFAMWAEPQQRSSQQIREFNLFASNDASFTTSTLLGSFVGNIPPLDEVDNVGQIFEFDPTAATYVRMEIVSNYGAPTIVGFSEGAFRASPAAVIGAPEPATVGLVSLGFGAIGFMSRRRRKAA